MDALAMGSRRHMAHFFDLFGGSAVMDWLFLVTLVVPLAAPLVQHKLVRHARPAQGV